MISLLYSSRLDKLCRVKLPQELCQRLSLHPGDELRLRYSSKGIFLTRAKACCGLCGGETRLRSVGRWFLCERCIDQVKATPGKQK